MEFYFLIAALLASVVYCGLSILLGTGISKTYYFAPHHEERRMPFVSVIIAARDEEQYIQTTLESVAKQNYRNFECIVINDRSTDGTEELVRKFCELDARFSLLNIQTLPPGVPGKKNALVHGIQRSRGEILCFTDADSKPGNDWLSGIVRMFNAKTGMVAGVSLYDGDSFRTRNGIYPRFAMHSKFKNNFLAVGSAGIGKPWLCGGANLSYRKAVYDEVGGFSAIMGSLSGDDDLFMQYVHAKTGWQIRFTLSPETFVRTRPPLSFGEYAHQRKRHFSVIRQFPPLLAIVGTLYQASAVYILILPLIGLFVTALLPFAVSFFLGKMLFDAVLAYSVAPMLGEQRSLWRPAVLEILFLVINAAVLPFGLRSNITWSKKKR